MVEQNCPLCGGQQTKYYHSDKNREYLQCSECLLVFVPQKFHLNHDKCKKEYDLHVNSPEDAGYRKFLDRLFIPMVDLLESESCGMDFGSGPGPTLSVMFEERGHKVDLFDFFYAPNQSVFSRQYDFITCSEVVEHLNNPGNELRRLWGCIRNGGYLGIMTKRVIDKEAFATWHYKNDKTHICFFSEQTVLWLSDFLGAKLIYMAADVVILKKVN